MEHPPKSTVNNLPYELLTEIFDFYRQDIKESYYRWSMRLGLVQAYTYVQRLAHRRARVMLPFGGNVKTIISRHFPPF
jgi:hypothetical protein